MLNRRIWGAIGTFLLCMKLAKVVGHVKGIPIWEYLREDGAYLVREYGSSQNGKRNYIIKSPSERLYCFSDYEGDLFELFLFIEHGHAEKEKYSCNLDSIYDEF